MFWCTVCIDLSSALHIQRKMTEQKSHDWNFVEGLWHTQGNNIVYLMYMLDTVFNEALLKSINICAAFRVIKKVKVHTRWSTPHPGFYTAGNNLVFLAQKAAWGPRAVWTGTGESCLLQDLIPGLSSLWEVAILNTLFWFPLTSP